MSHNCVVIPLPINSSTIELTIYGESVQDIVVEKEDAIENGEATFQIKEGSYYEYKISNGYCLSPSQIVSQSKVNQSSGRISPSVYVGTLSIDILDVNKIKCGEVKLEVQSIKTNYRDDYRTMLEEITEKCTDLLLQHSSPVSQYFEVDFNADSKILYQRFAFIKSIINSSEFDDAVHKIISSPVTKWKESEIVKDIRSLRRFNGSAIKQLASSNNRIDLPGNHSYRKFFNSIPSKIRVNNKTESTDTPENRFVKHALLSFQSFCNDFKTKLIDYSRIKNEAELLTNKLEQFLSHSVFKEVSIPNTLPLNSPILQRKEGYREVLRVWLMFDLAAKLVWHGGDDVYSGNKRDVAVLYEYWLFFKLLDIVKEVFKIEPKGVEQLIKKTDDGLGLQLKQGIHLPIRGIYDAPTRKLNVEFSYNRTFGGDNAYPASGSWTKSMRPDYTLSIWPNGIDSETAEREELITHIHFDAKYKVEHINDIIGYNEDLDTEKQDQKKGTFKRMDLLKMHAYKDAIRRTAGSYVLYPGTDAPYTKIGFHELIPGLGAFAVRPSKSDSGTEELKKFLNEVVSHFMNRASQREKISLKTYQTYKLNKPNELREALPETCGHNRNLIPDETFVLVGYATSKERFDWYEANGKYIFRMDESKGSLELSFEVVNSKYLLLRKGGEIESSDLFSIKSRGPKVFSKEQLIKLKYPLSKHPKDYYLEIDIERVTEEEYQNVKWKFKELDKYKSVIELEPNPYSKAGLPFTITLTELMQVAVKEY